ncbi:unnamed protein product [Absidia cylindrospora]
MPCPVVGGILVEGNMCSTFKMDLFASGIYRMIRLESFEQCTSRTSLCNMPSILLYLDHLKKWHQGLNRSTWQEPKLNDDIVPMAWINDAPGIDSIRHPLSQLLVLDTPSLANCSHKKGDLSDPPLVFRRFWKNTLLDPSPKVDSANKQVPLIKSSVANTVLAFLDINSRPPSDPEHASLGLLQRLFDPNPVRGTSRLHSLTRSTSTASHLLHHQYQLSIVCTCHHQCAPTQSSSGLSISSPLKLTLWPTHPPHKFGLKPDPLSWPGFMSDIKIWRIHQPITVFRLYLSFFGRSLSRSVSRYCGVDVHNELVKDLISKTYPELDPIVFQWCSHLSNVSFKTDMGKWMELKLKTNKGDGNEK